MTLFSIARPVAFRAPRAPAFPILVHTLCQGYKAKAEYAKMQQDSVQTANFTLTDQALAQVSE
jgi:hypothetical protein